MDEQFTLLGVFAHPDDELSMGGCLVRYALQGVRCIVACATRGDGPDAQSSDPAITTREALGRARLEELACSCRTLGIAPPLLLGWQDGELDTLDLEEAAGAVARLLRDVRPQVVVTHGPEGGYGHPDHIAVSRVVTRAWELAGDPAHEEPAKLYYTAIPRSILQHSPQLAQRRADIRGAQLPFRGVADEAITTVVDIAAVQARKDAARACHRTQFQPAPDGQPRGFFSDLPEEMRRRLLSHERFVLARTRGLTPAVPETGLFDGLPAPRTSHLAQGRDL